MKFACGWKKLRSWIKPAGGPGSCRALRVRNAPSGTSMVSQLLSRFGVYMGPEKVLTVSAEDNRDGFWEDDAFVKLNDEILHYFSGAWDAPPVVERGWEHAAGLLPIGRRAKRLLRMRGSLRVGVERPANLAHASFLETLNSRLENSRLPAPSGRSGAILESAERDADFRRP